MLAEHAAILLLLCPCLMFVSYLFKKYIINLKLQRQASDLIPAVATHALKVFNYLLGKDITVSNCYNCINERSLKNFGADTCNLIIVYTKWIGLLF